MPHTYDSGAVPGRFKPALEAAYQADLADEKLGVFYRTSFLCSLLYISFGFLDLLALPSNVIGAWTVRGVVVLATAAVAVAARYGRDAFLRHYTLITCLTYFGWGLGIDAIILLADRSDHAWSTYYAGLLLVSMALYTWTYLRPLQAGTVGFVLALAYIGLALVGQGMGQHDGWIDLLGNCFFLISANVAGVFALLMRERFSRKAFLLKNALRHDLQLEEEAKRQSEYLSEHDALTGLPNRVRFLRMLGELIEARRKGGGVAVLFLDLDGFKPVNDQHGHAVGDFVLRCVAERVRGAIRGSDVAARIGGDEFVVALPLAEHLGDGTIERVSAALRAAIGAPVELNGHHLRVSASIGAATCPEDGHTADQLIHAADRNMYESKRRRQRLDAAPA